VFGFAPRRTRFFFRLVFAEFTARRGDVFADGVENRAFGVFLFSGCHTFEKLHDKIRRVIREFSLLTSAAENLTINYVFALISEEFDALKIYKPGDEI
jgi:hypothetical protein